MLPHQEPSGVLDGSGEMAPWVECLLGILTCIHIPRTCGGGIVCSFRVPTGRSNTGESQQLKVQLPDMQQQTRDPDSEDKQQCPRLSSDHACAHTYKTSIYHTQTQRLKNKQQQQKESPLFLYSHSGFIHGKERIAVRNSFPSSTLL